MKLFTILALFSCAVFLSSCATFLSGWKQEVEISIPMKDVKLYVDTQYIGSGSSFRPILKKTFKNKQLRFEAEGYKTKHSVIVADHKSNYHILSWIPFIVLYAPFFDNSSNTWTYEDSYEFPPLRKYKYSDSSQKRITVNNVSFEINRGNFIYNIYPYNYYITHSQPIRSSSTDSIGKSNTIFDESLDYRLRKLNYKDTINTVFIDNVNSLTLDAKVIKIARNYVARHYSGLGMDIGYYNSYIESELTTVWMLKNIYDDTLRIDTITSLSDQFSDNYNEDDQNSLSTGDALETSLLDYLDLLNAKKVLELESNKVTFADMIKISKPSKSPTNIQEALKASVTVKSKEGHGSGFLVSNDGYIITNHHVVSSKIDYTVVDNDGKEYKAKVVRSNKANDLALLKIEGNFDMAFNLPDKQNYNVGDEVITIGTPNSVELGQSVAKGIVSGTRKNKGSNYMQTDISINRGNSGGPIILQTGELAGVVEYKLVGQGMEGLSFSIPAYEIIQSLSLSY